MSKAKVSIIIAAPLGGTEATYALLTQYIKELHTLDVPIIFFPEEKVDLSIESLEGKLERGKNVLIKEQLVDSVISSTLTHFYIKEYVGTKGRKIKNEEQLLEVANFSWLAHYSELLSTVKMLEIPSITWSINKITSNVHGQMVNSLDLNDFKPLQKSLVEDALPKLSNKGGIIFCLTDPSYLMLTHAAISYFIKEAKLEDKYDIKILSIFCKQRDKASDLYAMNAINNTVPSFMYPEPMLKEADDIIAKGQQHIEDLQANSEQEVRSKELNDIIIKAINHVIDKERVYLITNWDEDKEKIVISAGGKKVKENTDKSALIKIDRDAIKDVKEQLGITRMLVTIPKNQSISTTVNFLQDKYPAVFTIERYNDPNKLIVTCPAEKKHILEKAIKVNEAYSALFVPEHLKKLEELKIAQSKASTAYKDIYDQYFASYLEKYDKAEKEWKKAVGEEEAMLQKVEQLSGKIEKTMEL
jgi:hypothetical protein